MDFDPLYTQYTKLIDYVREHSPIVSELSTPTTRSQGTRSSRSPSRGRNGSRSGLGNGVKQKVERQGYWNEYDNPSEEEEGEGHYVVYVNNDPETIVKWPGQQSIESAADWIERRTRGPRIKIRKLINPNYEPQPEAARRPLLGAPNGTANGISRRSSNSDPDDADADEEDAYPFPPGYSTFYPSSSSPYSSQLPPHHSSLLLHASLGCFLAATILLFVSALLLATGRHKLRREVDAGVLTGASGAVVFLVLGMQCVVLRWDELGWVGKVGWAAGFLLLGGAGCAELLMVVRAGVL